ncbi:hypothetical protein I4U23_000036 [Adineta vaga]|nr:hypothetical protein I4U23_000036 [Adineta vaga]
MDDLLTKQQIIELIKNQDGRLTFIKPNNTSSSKVWSNFSYVYIDNRQQNFVCCQICKEVLHHKSINGTSSMIKHKNMCEQVKKTVNHNSTSTQQYFRPKATQTVSKKVKEKVTIAAVEFVSLDNRAFELLAGDGFVHLVQTIFEAGQDSY